MGMKIMSVGGGEWRIEGLGMGMGMRMVEGLIDLRKVR